MLCVMICKIHHPGVGFFVVVRSLVKVHQINLYQRQKSWSFHLLVDILYMACCSLFPAYYGHNCRNVLSTFRLIAA